MTLSAKTPPSWGSGVDVVPVPAPVRVPGYVDPFVRDLAEWRRRCERRHARRLLFGACMAGASIAVSALKVLSS